MCGNSFTRTYQGDNHVSGIHSCLITPFKNGKVDEQAFQDLVEWQIEQGSDALVPVGTTGESPTLSHDEHHRVVALCVEAAKGRVPVIAGTGSNNTAEAISPSEACQEGWRHRWPRCNTLLQQTNAGWLIAHYKAINDAVNCRSLFITSRLVLLLI